MWHNPKDAIFLVGYQCKGTNGRLLLDEHKVYIKGWRTEVKCQVKRFGFSGHLGQEEIFEYIKTLNPKNLIVQHGDPDSVATVCNWVKKNLPKINVYGPKVGDVIEL
jgi:predicted metal-dependent RNase